MIYLVTLNPTLQKCFLTEVKDFDELVNILNSCPFSYDIFVTMKSGETNDKLKEWSMIFYDCNS